MKNLLEFSAPLVELHRAAMDMGEHIMMSPGCITSWGEGWMSERRFDCTRIMGESQSLILDGTAAIFEMLKKSLAQNRNLRGVQVSVAVTEHMEVKIHCGWNTIYRNPIVHVSRPGMLIEARVQADQAYEYSDTVSVQRDMLWKLLGNLSSDTVTISLSEGFDGVVISTPKEKFFIEEI